MYVEYFSFSKDYNGVEYITRTKKIPQKRVRAAFVKKEELFSQKCLQVVD